MKLTTVLASATLAVVSLTSVAACGAVARHVSEEASVELANQVRDHVLDHAGGTPLATVSLFADALDAVVARDAAAEDEHSTFIPSSRGLDDDDGDGLDDDGRFEIDVRHAAACLIVDGRLIRIVDGRC